ncbi:MAG: GyrI-like domain-containing protein [Planctomycetes bacterium]|nr:GyrI-like domain-containing protein [Planctomycetota bacterium]
MQLSLRVWLAASCLTLGACASLSRSSSPSAATNDIADLRVAHAPFDQVEANWKQRLDQPYVYVELVGSYTRIGKALEAADAAMRRQGLPASGPPFALYFDDPAHVAAEKLRARACFPIDSRVEVESPLATDVLPGTTVVYAFVAGPYPEVPRAYPGVFAFLERMHWREAGPIREIYWVHPGSVTDWNELVTEVQIPASARE